MDKTIIYNVRLNGVDVAIDSMKQLKDLQRQYTKELDNVKIGSERYKQLKGNVAAIKTEQQKFNEEIRNQQREQTKTTTSAKGSYRALQAELTNLKKEYKELGVEAREGIYGQGIKKQIGELSNGLKRIDQGIGDNFRNIGNYGSAIGGNFLKVVGGLGLTTSAIGIVSSALRSSVRIIKDFDSAETELAANLGKTREETKLLSDQARELGANTVFTAGQVLKLQTALVKLGFSESEILNTTESVLNLSTALGVEAERAAQLTGSTLRAFNLEAAESERVASVLAISTLKSALSFEKLETSISVVGPVADAFGFTLEDTTALLGVLSNAGFDASSGATALRNILLNLADSNGKLAKSLGRPISSLDELAPALRELRESGVSLNETLQLTDKRSVAAFNKFLDGADDALELRDAITDVSDELDTLVNTQLGSLDNQLKLTQSAWEGFIISLEDGEGPISKVFETLLTGISDTLNGLTALNTGSGSFLDVINPFTGGILGLGKRTREQKTSEADLKDRLGGRSLGFLDSKTDEEKAAEEARLAELEKLRKKEAEKRQKERERESRKIATEQEKQNRAYAQALSDLAKLEEEAAKEGDKELDKRLKEELEKVKLKEKAEFELKEYYDDLAKNLDSELAKEADELAKVDEDRIKRQAELEFKYKADAAKKIADEKNRINEEIEQTAFDIAEQFLQARIDREREALETETEEKLDAVDAEYADRLKAAEGNAEETERLNKIIEEQKTEIKRKQFEENKKISIKEALINGAIAAIQALSNTILPFPASLTALIPVAAQTALQIGVISSQTFDEGGFTGSGGGIPDHTGEVPAGVVHKDEYVTPKAVLRTARGRQLVNELEGMRLGMGYRSRHQGYYADGGFTIPAASGVAQQQITVQNNLKLSPEDINTLAKAVETGSERGTNMGANEGLSRAALEQERDMQIIQDLSI